MSRIGVYPGSFDPVTNGHLDILKRALRIFDHVVVAIVHNPNKQGFFTHQERADLLGEILADEKRIEIDVFSGLLVDYVEEKGAHSIIRGLRAVADFEFEFQMASMNRRLKKELDTIFLMTDERHFYVSSSLVKEVARLKGDISGFVPPAVAKALAQKYGQ
jgi:pantetheine-phosphate adenylyltransferase